MKSGKANIFNIISDRATRYFYDFPKKLSEDLLFSMNCMLLHDIYIYIIYIRGVHPRTSKLNFLGQMATLQALLNMVH